MSVTGPDGMADSAQKATDKARSEAESMASEAKSQADSAKGAMADAGEQAKDAAADVEQQAKGVVAEAQKQAQHLTEEAQKSTSAVTEQARQTAAQAGQKADDAARAAARQLDSAAGQIRGQTQATVDAASRQLENIGAPDAVRQPAQATIQYAAGAAESVAQRLERGGAYLEEQGATGLLEDLAGVVRRHPLPVLGSLAALLAVLLILLRRPGDMSQ
jgi:hypothetical protein